MGGLKLGDLILDPRRVVYIPSLKAVVCAGLHEALSIGIADGLRGVLERVDAVLEEYAPESLIIVGHFTEQSALTGITRRWGKRAKIHLIANDPSVEARGLAEALGCEVHHELIWGRYRFVEAEDSNAFEAQLTTMLGKPNYSVKVGNPLGGMKLPVFLKGIGKIYLPSLDPSTSGTSVFSENVGRFDVFAVGHQRMLPMGKVADLKSAKEIVRGLPVAKATLGARKRTPKEPSAD